MIEHHVVNSICNQFNLTHNELRSQSRKTHLVDARQSCALALRKLGKTYKFIANIVNRKDHTTIMHLIKRRSHNWHENERIAHETVKAYENMDSPKIRTYKVNMEEFLEMVQQKR